MLTFVVCLAAVTIILGIVILCNGTGLTRFFARLWGWATLCFRCGTGPSCCWGCITTPAVPRIADPSQGTLSTSSVWPIIISARRFLPQVIKFDQFRLSQSRISKRRMRSEKKNCSPYLCAVINPCGFGRNSFRIVANL